MNKRKQQVQCFELYVLKDQLLAEHWTQLYKAIVSYTGAFSKFELVFCATDNILRFFVRCDKDLSVLSNNIEGLLLRPISAEEIKPPQTTTPERFFQYAAGGNLLNLKEKFAIKKSKQLEYAAFNIRAVNAEKAIVRMSYYFKNAGGNWSRANRLATFFPANLLAVDFAANTKYIKKTVPRYLDIEKSVQLLTSDSENSLFEVDAFPYFSHKYFLGLTSYDFDKHSFIVGASGSGKSKLISLFVDRLYQTSLKMNYRVIVIDPHASMADDFAHIAESKVINFNNESTGLFAGTSTDISAATELTATLFKSLLGGQHNAKLDRLLRFTLFVLFTAQNMSLDNLKRFLTNVELRNQIIQHVTGYVPDNIVRFFGADFNEMRTKYYNETISPLVSLVDELQMQPLLVGEGELSLAKTIQDNFLTVFSLNKVSMGDRVVKTVAGLLIQQIFLLAQARAFDQRIILVIDEVSVVQNPALASILAEARKFNLSVVLTQQYFGQIDKDLRDAIFANVYNYYAFKVSEEDARALEGNLNIDLPKALMEEERQKGLKESDVRVKIMTELHPRECLVRVLANGRVVPAIKARTVTAPDASLSTAAATGRLRAYRQAATALPAKFQEGRNQNESEPSPSVVQSSAKPTNFFNLSELLAQHSSSRFKINKRKDI